jgi:hypothetical protein
MGLPFAPVFAAIGGEHLPMSHASRFTKRPSVAQIAKRSFADQEIARKAHLIHKLKAKDTTGRWAYYFVLVEPHRERAFEKAIDGDGIIDLENFGKVIASCYGEAPSQELKDFLQAKYGFEV